MTFQTHLALTFTFLGIASLDLSVESVNKTTRLFADIINPLSTIGFRSSILANSADPDATFDQRLHCLLRQKRSSVKEYICFSKILLVAPPYIHLLAIVYHIISR